MKKIMALLLVAVMVLTFAACGTTTETPAAEKTETEQLIAEKEPVEEIVEESAEEPTEAEVEEVEVTFAEQVLVEDDNCTVKVTGIEADGLWGYTLKVFLENKTDTELMYSLEKVAVNGFMCDPFWATSVTAKMRSNEEISFSSDSFEKNGITIPTDISFTLRVYDNNDWSADAFVEEDFVIYPLGEDAVQPYTREDQPNDIVLFDNEQCRMIVTGFDPDGMWGYTMQVYLENKTDVEQMFSADGVAVNGFMCDPFWAESVAAGKRSNTEITWYEDDFAMNGITEVTEIVLPIRVYDNNDWNAADFVDDTFTVNP